MARHAAPNRPRWLTPTRRRWTYRVLLAAVPLLTVYGIVDDQTAALWIALACAVLGLGTADLHVPEG